ncbi:HAD family hydrolase [Mangrovibacterium lignilyticum]|uniref:HAD family hydrolase n=1 Tax=Mangrovibacterium lignilyticum TaxID=2668052 RepID=UPI0013D2240F|nr:HAD family hydrolase [Mangrovibacterium lignilyticum]
MDYRKKIGLVATDLDGTLLRKDKSISKEDLDMLTFLGEHDIIRVVATGRNYRKVKEVIPENAPFDYVAFSSGAGIYDCRTNELLYKQNISVPTTNAIIKKLVEKRLNFYLFKGIPQNSYCWYYRGQTICQEFERYYSFHHEYAGLLPDDGEVDTDSCQFLVMFQEADAYYKLKEKLEREFDEIKVLRASSPLDTGYVWMEIFHKAVSKGNAIEWLCDLHGIPHSSTFSIGNDYNDLDLLDFTSISYLVDNGPEELKHKYLKAPSNEESGFSFSIRNHLF